VESWIRSDHPLRGIRGETANAALAALVEVDPVFTLALAGYDFVRLPKLMMETNMPSSPENGLLQQAARARAG